jgi:hypothetical protein
MRDTSRIPGTEIALVDQAANAQALVAFYVDRCREIGADPPRRVVGHVAQQLGQLAAEGYDQPTLEAALALMLDRRLHPSTLPSLIVEAQAGPGRTAREHIADRLARHNAEQRRRL